MILLLPERRRFSGQPLAAATARRLGRADRLPDAEPGERAQLLRHFQLSPRAWPMAAISRERDVGDARQGAWLRADPVYVRAEATGARLHAWGTLGLSPAESAEFLALLQPVFGDAGLALSAPSPERWYLAVERGSPLPDFADPAEAIGADLLSLLPAGPQGRRWRALFNEAQVLLHQHPRNAARLAAGQAPVNALWFWGAGTLPDAVRCAARQVLSEDAELLALARLAGVQAPEAGAEPDAASALVDLRRQRDWSKIERLLAEAGRGPGDLLLDFADGASWRLQPRQRWRFWRPQLTETAFQADATAVRSAEAPP